MSREGGFVIFDREVVVDQAMALGAGCFKLKPPPVKRG